MHYICVYKIAYTCMHKYQYMIYVLYIYIFICDPLIQPLFGRSNLQSQGLQHPGGGWRDRVFSSYTFQKDQTIHWGFGLVQASCQALDIQGQHPAEKVGLYPKIHRKKNNFLGGMQGWILDV